MADSPALLEGLFGVALIRLMREHRAAVARELGPLGLHVGQEMLLDALVRGAGATQAELARAMGVEAPTVTKMLQRLDSGLLERLPDPSDRRMVRVWPTERARDLHTEVLRRWAAVDARMLAGLAPKQTDALRSTVAAMTSNLATAPGRTSRAGCRPVAHEGVPHERP